MNCPFRQKLEHPPKDFEGCHACQLALKIIEFQEYKHNPAHNNFGAQVQECHGIYNCPIMLGKIC